AGTSTGIEPVGRLIERSAEVVPVIVRAEFARFAAENWVWKDPDVTMSTSVSVPIVALKYRRDWSLRFGFASRSGHVAVWVMVAEAAAPPVRSWRPSSVLTAGQRARRGRRPTSREKRRGRIAGRLILLSLDRGGSRSGTGAARTAIRAAVLGETRLVRGDLS